ncbi:MAG TPA: MBL fold metallo-hydrolase [Abditibacteriaceae bacterium]|nr:MBL fold metallo-hydrolase [Abditibacteriaceae bacterium]
MNDTVAITLAAEIAQRQIKTGHISAWWLGGSGFVFKTPGGLQVFIDPYLSDVVNAIWGLERALPAPIRAGDARPDVCISTHWHEDHLDPGTIPVIAQNSPATRFVMPPSAMSRAAGWGVPRDRIAVLSNDQSLEIGDIKITATPARHDAGLTGWEAPDAMGVILEATGLKIYHSGDTEYDNRLRMMWRERFDVATVPINGVTGNMNAHEAALLCWQLGAKTVIPHHHLLWASNPGGEDATWDPNLFAQTYANLGGAGRVMLPEIGVEMEF